MNTALKLSLYGAGLIAAFGTAYLLGGLLIPDSFVDSWITEANTHSH